MNEVLLFFGVLGAALLAIFGAFAVAIGVSEIVFWLDRRNQRIQREREMRRDHS